MLPESAAVESGVACVTSVSGYELGPIFPVRVTGAPFDWLDRLATRESSAIARRRLALFDELEVAARQLQKQFATERRPGNLKKAVARRKKLPASAAAIEATVAYSNVIERLEESASELDRVLKMELARAGDVVAEFGRTTLRRYVVFASERMGGRVDYVGGGVEGNLFKHENRRLMRLLAAFVQRVCAKNDTISEFGPVIWGVVDERQRGLRIAPRPGIARREVYLERWVIQSVVDGLNQDPLVRPELAPGLHPLGRLVGTCFVREDTGAEVPLDDDAMALLRACGDGRPAYAVGSLDALTKLAGAGVLLWEAQSVALDPHAIDGLVRLVEGFRDGEAKSRWLAPLRELAGTRAAFRARTDPAGRDALMHRVRTIVTDMGTSAEASVLRPRDLYRAANPIGEACVRDGEVIVGKDMAMRLTDDAAPWLDLWRDIYVLMAGRVNAHLRDLVESAPRAHGRLSFIRFLDHCRKQHGSSLNNGVMTTARKAFVEARTALLAQLEDRGDRAEVSLTAEDCSVVRRTFPLERFDEYTWPSADLMIDAESPDAVARGDYRWVVAELHAGGTMLQHSLVWACPDLAALRHTLRRTSAGRPSFAFGDTLERCSHVLIHLGECLGDVASLVSPRPVQDGVRRVIPSDAEVWVDPSTGDVRVRETSSGRHIGSLARSWVSGMGSHPFAFVRRPHSPRLLCGRVVVQRRVWTVRREELTGGPYNGLSPDLVVAVERLRAEKGLPRRVFILPTDRMLARNSAVRDKDAKPIFVDFESYLFLDMFNHWLSSYDELEVSEMLPEAGLWREPEGQFTFELRTIITPA